MQAIYEEEMILPGTFSAIFPFFTLSKKNILFEISLDISIFGRTIYTTKLTCVNFVAYRNCRA